jgi:hypothetical protein
MLPRLAHGGGGRPVARGWVVNFGTGKDRVKRNSDCLGRSQTGAADNQHFAVRQQRRRVGATPRLE